MKKTILFHIFKSENYYVAEGIDLPVVTQGETLDVLIANLKEAIELHLEDNDNEKFDMTSNPVFMANLELDITRYAEA